MPKKIKNRFGNSFTTFWCLAILPHPKPPTLGVVHKTMEIEILIQDTKENKQQNYEAQFSGFEKGSKKFGSFMFSLIRIKQSGFRNAMLGNH